MIGDEILVKKSHAKETIFRRWALNSNLEDRILIQNLEVAVLIQIDNILLFCFVLF